MARKKKDVIDQNDIQVIEQKQENNKENKENIIVQDTRTLEQKLNSYKRKLRRI